MTKCYVLAISVILKFKSITNERNIVIQLEYQKVTLLDQSNVGTAVSAVTNELITDLRGAWQSIAKSSIAAFATSLRTSEKAKWVRPLTAYLQLGVFSNLQA